MIDNVTVNIDKDLLEILKSKDLSKIKYSNIFKTGVSVYNDLPNCTHYVLEYDKKLDLSEIIKIDKGNEPINYYLGIDYIKPYFEELEKYTEIGGKLKNENDLLNIFKENIAMIDVLDYKNIRIKIDNKKYIDVIKDIDNYIIKIYDDESNLNRQYYINNLSEEILDLVDNYFNKDISSL